jgi:hypothetical protein
LFLLRGHICPVLTLSAALAFAFPLFPNSPGNAQAANVTASRLDGSTISGDLRNWSENQVVIAAPGGEEQIPVEQLMSIRWLAPPAAEKQAAAEASGLAELIDGTLIPFNSVRIDSGKAILTFERPGDANNNQLTVPAAKLAAVRFQRLVPTLAGQWDQIRGLKLATDALVVLKRDGQSLDYYEGGIGDVTQESVEFKLDGETNHVDRSRVAGLIYFRPNRKQLAEPRVSLHGRSGLRASAMQVKVENSLVSITTTGGDMFTWPVDDIELADFSRGKVMYVSDMEPASQNWAPLISLPSGDTLAAEYGQPRRDRSAFGDKLSLLAQGSDEDSSPGAKQSFDKGLAVRSRTELVYRLPAGFNRFKAHAGIDPATRTSGNLRLAIFADDRPLLETDVAGDQPPQAVDVEITGAKRLRILVDFGQNQDTGDWLNLCDAKIVK